MATRNGSDALKHDTGRLEVGRKADLVLIETNSPMFTPLMPGDKSHIYSHLVFAANGSCVDTTIVDGQIVMEGRKLLTVNEDDVVREANAAFMRVLERVNAAKLARAPARSLTLASPRVERPK
jgi:5-methylthioadenosine/S-adenosylhomocysteine deaminase